MLTEDQIAEGLEALAARVDSRCASGAEAVRLTEVMAKCQRLAETLKLRHAQRATSSSSPSTT